MIGAYIVAGFFGLFGALGFINFMGHVSDWIGRRMYRRRQLRRVLNQIRGM